MNKCYLKEDDRHTIHCALCGKPLKTFEILDDVWDPHDRVYYPQTNYSTDEGVLHKKWICLDCDRNLSDIVKQNINKAGRDYVDTLSNRLKEINKEYEARINHETRMAVDIDALLKRLNAAKNLSDLDKETIKGLENCLFTRPHTFFIHEAIEKERAKANALSLAMEKPVVEWAEKYGFILSEAGQSELAGKTMTLEEFHKLTEDSKWFNIKFSDWGAKRKLIEEDLAKL